MRGVILHYSDGDHRGFISGHDGNRYNFTRVDWVAGGAIKVPKQGLSVDFEIGEGKAAINVIAIDDSADFASSASDDIADGLMAFVWRFFWLCVKLTILGAVILTILWFMAIFLSV